MVIVIKERFFNDLVALGIREDDTVMIHTSFRSLGKIEGGAKTLISWLLEYIGDKGTLVFPAFSYNYVTRENPVFDQKLTKSNIGYFPEFVRSEVKEAKRSLHPTHSCSVIGKRRDELIQNHELDLTPVGKNSPIMKLPDIGGKVLFIGCPVSHATIMHGVEELAEPPYLYEKEPIEYTMVAVDGTVYKQTAKRHNFVLDGVNYIQRYDKLTDLLPDGEKTHGKLLEADCWCLSCEAIRRRGKQKLIEDPFFFVEQEQKIN